MLFTGINKAHIDVRVRSISLALCEFDEVKPEIAVFIDVAVERHGTAVQIVAFINRGQHTQIDVFDHLFQLLKSDSRDINSSTLLLIN